MDSAFHGYPRSPCRDCGEPILFVSGPGRSRPVAVDDHVIEAVGASGSIIKVRRLHKDTCPRRNAGPPRTLPRRRPGT